MLQKLVALKFLTLAFVCLTTEAQDVQKDRTCPTNWIWQPSKPSVCYYISTQRLGFHAADKSCKDKSSSLASVLSFEEHGFISRELLALRKGCNAKEDCVNFWIGLRTLNSGSNWTYDDGSQISPATSFWDKGYPSGKGNCGLMHVQDSDREVMAYWRDENCDEPQAYICKQGITCPAGFVFVPKVNICYKLITEVFNWTDASKMCQDISPGVHLATILSEAENEAIIAYFEAEISRNPYVCSEPLTGWSPNAWIGARRIRENCSEPVVWNPSDKVQIPLNYTFWFQLQPNCGNGIEHCLHITQIWFYQWNDHPCSERKCALCQRRIEKRI